MSESIGPVAPAPVATPPRAPATLATPAPLWAHDATAVAAMIRAREVSATEVVEAAIARIEETHEAINAVVLPCFDDARARARELDRALARGEPVGPLAGVPVSVKDQVRVAGLPTTLGLRSRLTRVDRDEGPLVTRLRAAGAIIVGKTNTPQLLFGFETDNKLHGRTNNPWDVTRSPAGSSGGEAANIAAGGAALGLGGDLGGSVRAPAAMTGLFGLRPTVGRLSLLDLPPDVGFSPLHGLTPQLGPLARSARDIGLAMSVLVDVDGGDPTELPVPLRRWTDVRVEQLRVGYFDDDGLVTPSPAIRRGVHEAVEALAAAGAHVEALPAPPIARGLHLAMALLSSDGGRNIAAALGDDEPDPALAETLRGMGAPRLMLRVIVALLRWKKERRMADLLANAGKRDARGVSLLLGEREQLRAGYLRTLEERRLDLVVCPTVALLAARHGFPEQGMLTSAATFFYSLLDLPAGVAPVTRARAGEETDRAIVEPADRAFQSHELGSAGLPVCVQIAGRPFREDVVIAAMAAIEAHARRSDGYPATPIDPRTAAV